MAQVKFHGMMLDFSIVKSLYALSEELFNALIFQFEIAEPNRWNDKYALVAYPVDKTGNVTAGKQKIALVQIPGKDHDVAKKLLFGNLIFSRNEIKPFIDYDKTTPIAQLNFEPYKFTNTNGDGEYVAYIIKSIDATKGVMPLVEGDLKPSPPAIPPSLISASPK